MIVSSASEPFNKPSIPITFIFDEAVVTDAEGTIISLPAAAALFDVRAVSLETNEELNFTLTNLRLRKMEWSLTVNVDSTTEFNLTVDLITEAAMDEAGNAFVGGSYTLDTAGAPLPGPFTRSVDMRPLYCAVTTAINPTTSRTAELRIAFTKPVFGTSFIQHHKAPQQYTTISYHRRFYCGSAAICI
jgi:hypothetical protein